MSTRISTTGRVVVIEWSQRGDASRRKQRWAAAVRRLKGTRVFGHVWHFKTKTLEAIRAELGEITTPSDRVLVFFPFGRARGGASTAYLHLFP